MATAARPHGADKANMSTFAERLREAIAGRYSYAQIGAACGVSRTAVSRWANGKVTQVRSQYAFAVAEKCQVDPQWLISGIGTKERSGVMINTMRPQQAALLRDFESMPPELHAPVRAIIEALAERSSVRRNGPRGAE